MYALGFSLNNLTLMALTISTGFVVDDAIVMIENITRYVEQGEAPLEAALKGAEQIGFTIMSLTVSLIAVLIPLLFMGDITGRLFREFAITLSATILISAVRLADPDADAVRQAAASTRTTPQQGRFYQVVGARLRAASSISTSARSTGCWSGARLTLLVAVGTLVLTVLLTSIVPKGFFPGAGHGRDPGGVGGRRRASRSPRWRSCSSSWPRRS